MAQKTRAQLQALWITGATMTESLFDDVWDSFVNIQDDGTVGTTGATGVTGPIGPTGTSSFPTGTTQSLYNLGATSIQILGGVGSQGLMTWDAVEESIALVLNGTTSHINLDTYYHVRNTTGSTIPLGTPVYANGTVGGSGKITVAPFIADGSIPARLLLGVTTEAIANNSNGKVAHFGRVNQINTLGATGIGEGETWTDGTILWCSGTTAGKFTNTEPTAPNQKLAVAFVAYAHQNEGVLYVRHTEGHKIDDSHDVEITNPQDRDRLSWDAANQRWTNTSPQDLSYRNTGATGFLATNSERLFLNHTEPITITGPTSPSVNTVYEMIDAGATCGTHNVTFKTNGYPIYGPGVIGATSWLMDANAYVLKIVFNGTGYNVI